MALPYTNDARYQELVHLVINIEGGFVDNPKDPGGPTMFGIAWNYNTAALKSMGMTRDNMAHFTIDQAREVYYEKYYKGSNAHKIEDKRVAFIHFDTAVNCGIGKATQISAQLSVNPFTLSAANGANALMWMRLFTQYVAFRLDWYEHCANRKTFIEGWVNRIIRVIELGLTF